MNERRTSQAPTDSTPSSGRRRVLVADDNKDSADTLALLLGVYGHEVRVAHGGHAALALARTFRPECAVLDIGMPDLDGYQVAQALRREPWGKDMQLIAITGWGRHEDRLRALAAGFDEHLTKPANPEELKKMLSH